MIYLISDDNFFSLGVTSYLDSQNIPVMQLAFDEAKNVHFTSSDTVLLSLKEQAKIMTYLDIISRYPCRTVFYIDLYYEFNVINLQSLIVCKKNAPLRMLKYINNTQRRASSVSLSPSQKRVLSDLFSGEIISNAETVQRYSRRSISEIKIAVFQRLGIKSFTSQIIALLTFVIARAA